MPIRHRTLLPAELPCPEDRMIASLQNIKAILTQAISAIDKETEYITRKKDKKLIPRSLDYFTARIPNPKGNILILCPNCHKYFDTGVLSQVELQKIESKIKTILLQV